MRSLKLDLERYDTDKIVSQYLDRYDPILEPWVEKKIVLLELGVFKGSSLLLWHDYFPLGTIVGIDRKLPNDFSLPPAGTERIHMYEGSQADPKFLSRVANEVAADGFDIIIDDCSHIGELTKISFWHLFDNHLKPGGLYVIEDWGTGYQDHWADGKSLNLDSYLQSPSKFKKFWLKAARKLRLKIPMRCHSYGMVGFVKQLVDAQGGSDGGLKFEKITIFPTIVFIKKH